MAAVSNSIPLIFYARIGHLELLERLFTEILIPPAVWREVVEAGADRVGSSEVRQANWIHQRPLPIEEVAVRLAGLDRGESEALALASSLRPAVPILLDDYRARKVAQAIGLVVIGSAGLLGLAKRAGLIASIKPILIDLLSAGLFLDEATVRELLEISGEG